MYEIHQGFFMNVPSHEAELSTPKVTHEFIRELYKSDVSRVKGVTP
jgi:hypothetical protein